MLTLAELECPLMPIKLLKQNWVTLHCPASQHGRCRAVTWPEALSSFKDSFCLIPRFISSTKLHVPEMPAAPDSPLTCRQTPSIQGKAQDSPCCLGAVPSQAAVWDLHHPSASSQAAGPSRQALCPLGIEVPEEEHKASSTPA